VAVVREVTALVVVVVVALLFLYSGFDFHPKNLIQEKLYSFGYKASIRYTWGKDAAWAP
jgi:hypothetical protein